MGWILLEKMREGATGSDRSESKARLLQCQQGKREPSAEPFFHRVTAVQKLAVELARRKQVLTLQDGETVVVVTVKTAKPSADAITYADAACLAAKHFPESYAEYELSRGIVSSRGVRRVLDRAPDLDGVPSIADELKQLIGQRLEASGDMEDRT